MNKHEKIITKREVLKKVNALDDRIKRYEHEIIHIEYRLKKKKDMLKDLNQEFDSYLKQLYSVHNNINTKHIKIKEDHD